MADERRIASRDLRPTGTRPEAERRAAAASKSSKRAAKHGGINEHIGAAAVHQSAAAAFTAIGDHAAAAHHTRRAAEHHTQMRARAVHVSAVHAISDPATRFAALPTQTGKKGGKFVISKSGKKRYV